MSYRYAAYVPIEALTAAEQARYRAEVREKRGRYPHLFRGEAARAGLRARIVSERRSERTPAGESSEYPDESR